MMRYTPMGMQAATDDEREAARAMWRTPMTLLELPPPPMSALEQALVERGLVPYEAADGGHSWVRPGRPPALELPDAAYHAAALVLIVAMGVGLVLLKGWPS